MSFFGCRHNVNYSVLKSIVHLEAIAFTVCFGLLRKEQRAWASKLALVLIFIPRFLVFGLYILAYKIASARSSDDSIAVARIGVLTWHVLAVMWTAVLSMTVAGSARSARIPLLGPF